jgi:hypothetical protein
MHTNVLVTYVRHMYHYTALAGMELSANTWRVTRGFTTHALT